MCGVIVVDAGRSRSTILGCDAYIMSIAWISSWLFEVLSIAQQQFVYPLFAIFSREKPLVKPMAPGSLSHIIFLCDLFYFPFIFISIKPKIQKYLTAIYSYLFYLAFNLSIYYNLFSCVLPISSIATRKGLTTPLIHRVTIILSDVGFRKTLGVRTMGCARSLFLPQIYALTR